MPNLKIFVDDARLGDIRAPLVAALPGLRDRLCRALAVDPAISQMAILPVIGLPDQPALNVELHLLAAPTRDREALRALATELREALAQATGLSVAVRIASFDPAGYVTLK
ncbi:hypothetical protein [Marinibacterium sp. SX1]|uniref:hypothetical protein n=1 Tax=Marinibacterium sp. SX1 TaxID=3388424 RepID=UPI003D17FE43